MKTFKKNYSKLLKHIQLLMKNVSGSEVVEVVYSAAVCCFVIISCMMILGYAVQCNNLAHAGKQIVRAIEISGVVNEVQINNLKNELIPNANEIGVDIKVSPKGGYLNKPGVSPTEQKIQLRQKFEMILTANYKLTVATFGAHAETIPFPIRIKINGQSEVYWKTGL